MKTSQPSRWTTCCQCHGALDTKGDIAHFTVDGVKRSWHIMCLIRFSQERRDERQVQAVRSM